MNMKLLMLHGFTQNGDIFSRKVRPLQRRIEEKWPGSTFCYPSGHIALEAADKPGSVVPRTEQDVLDNETGGLCGPRQTEATAWFYINTCHIPLVGWNHSLDRVARILEEEGPFDGIIAFSQGTVLAAAITSLLEGERRRKAFQVAQTKCQGTTIVPYPESFERLSHPPLKFALLYSGMMPRQPEYSWLYQEPRIETPICHYMGLWDPVVAHGETKAIFESISGDGADGLTVFVHPGCHHVPTAPDYVNLAVTWIEKQMDLAHTASRHDSLLGSDVEDSSIKSGTSSKGPGERNSAGELSYSETDSWESDNDSEDIGQGVDAWELATRLRSAKPTSPVQFPVQRPGRQSLMERKMKPVRRTRTCIRDL